MSNKLTKKVKEASVEIKVSGEEKISRKLPVFYNPLMKSNRDISILLLNSVENKNMNIADPLAGTGIRSLRFLKGLKTGKINHLFINDKKDDFIKVFNENLENNRLRSTNISVFSEDASLFLLNRVNDKRKPDNFCGFFDYIDLDVFGTINPFIDAAIARICRKGILAITATDTAALTGTYPKVTKRKYWAKSLKNYMMHETGLRILIRKVQLQGIQFDKALIPILSYHKDHYFRIYFRCEKGKQKCDQIIRKHQYLLFCPKCLNYNVSDYNWGKCDCGSKFDFAGPLWTGKLFDSKLLDRMARNNLFPEEQKFLDILKEESMHDVLGFYDLHAIARRDKRDLPKMEVALKRLKGVRTHFDLNGVKTEKSFSEVMEALR